MPWSIIDKFKRFFPFLFSWDTVRPINILLMDLAGCVFTYPSRFVVWKQALQHRRKPVCFDKIE